VRVLLTGARGQVGSALVERKPTPIELFAMDRQQLDICDRARIVAVVRELKPDVIVNAAAYTAVDRAESDAERAHEMNALGPRYLAEVSASMGSRLIHISTDYVFDGESRRAYRPGDSTNPLSVYGRTKLAGERAVTEVLPTYSVILRTSWVYGAVGNNFVRTMLTLLKEKGVVRVVADQIGTPTSATSIANVIWAMVGRSVPAGTYHWTDAGVASWYDLAFSIAEEAAAINIVPLSVQVLPITSEQYPTAARRPRMSLLDSSATRLVTEIEPVHWRVELRRTLREMKLA
jgi:dTDP-4-dehydrorhamnose reductase